MKITITSVYQSPSIAIGYTEVPGYWVDFMSDSLSGPAILIPYDSLVRPTLGQVFFVEPDFETISHICVLASDDQRPLGIHHIADHTAYEVVATVQHKEQLTDPINKFSITINANVIGFTLNACDIGDIELTQHDKILITINVLELWDEHL